MAPYSNRMVLPLLLLLLQAFCTFALTGLIWFVQMVHYPLFAAIPDPHHATYAAGHQTRTGWVVAPIMLLELATSLAMLWSRLRPAGLPFSLAALGLLLVAIIWLSTVFLQIPLHQSLLQVADSVTVRRLVHTNWIRTVAWTLRSVLLLAVLMQNRPV